MKHLLFVVCSLLQFQYAQTQVAENILKEAEQKVRGNTSYSEVNIQIIRPSWKRYMSMKAWGKGNDYAIILITSPAHDKGTVFLKRKKEVWNWVPSIERTIKLPPSMMQQSWMGTDFTNSDLVREDSYVNDYSSAITGDSTIEGRDCYKITLLPKPHAGVVWGKVICFISKKDLLELRLEFFDEDGYLVNIMNATDIKTLGGRTLPAKLEMIPQDKPGQKTIMIYQNLLFDKPVDESFFTIQNMQRIK